MKITSQVEQAMSEVHQQWRHLAKRRQSLNDWRWTSDQQRDIDDMASLIHSLYNALNRLIAANQAGHPCADGRNASDTDRRPVNFPTTEHCATQCYA